MAGHYCNTVTTLCTNFITWLPKDYVVYFSNPRGGRGYGEAHAEANHAAWGSCGL